MGLGIFYFGIDSKLSLLIFLLYWCLNYQVDAHIYLWKWNARIVISDVDGTITKYDI